MISWTTRVLNLLGTNGYMVYCSCISVSIMLGYYQWYIFQMYHPSTRDVQPKTTHTHSIMWFKLCNDYHHPHVLKRKARQFFDHFPKYKVDPYKLEGSDCTYKGHNPSYPFIRPCISSVLITRKKTSCRARKKNIFETTTNRITLNPWQAEGTKNGISQGAYETCQSCQA